MIKATTLSSVWLFNLETGKYTRTPRESSDHPYVPYTDGPQDFDTVEFTNGEDGNPAPGVFVVRTGPGLFDFVRSFAQSVEPVATDEYEVTS